MRERCKIKKYVSLLLALVMLFGAVMPTAAAETDPASEMPALFAMWADGSGFVENLEIPGESSSPVKFYYGTSRENCVEVPWGAALTVGGVAQYETIASDPYFGERFYRIGVTGEGPATVSYTDENGVVYTFAYSGVASQDSDAPQTEALFVRFADTDIYTPSLGMSPGVVSQLVFYYGDIDNPQEATEITDSTALSKTDGVVLEYAGDYWNVSLEDGYQYGEIFYGEAIFSISLVDDDMGGEPEGNGEPTLYAIKPDGTGYATELTFGKNSCDTYFLYVGVPGNATKLTWADFDAGKLTQSGIADFFKYEFDGIEDLFFIGTGDTEGIGAVTYTDGSVTYTIPVNCVDSSGEEPVPDTPQLFAKWADGSGFVENLEIPGESSSPVKFYYGTSRENCVEVPWGAVLTTNDIASCEPVESDPMFGQHFYHLSVTGEGVATVTYTDENGVAYTYTFAGIPGTGPSAPQGDALFARFAGTDIYTPSMGISPGNVAQLIFYYGDISNPQEATEITDSTALSKTDGVALEHAGEYWNVSLENTYRYGEISLVGTDAKFTISLVENEGPEPEERDPALQAKIVGESSYMDSLLGLDPYGTLVVFYYGTAPGGQIWEEISDGEALTASDIQLEYIGAAEGTGENNVWKITFPAGIYAGTVTHMESGSTLSARTTTSNGESWVDGIEGTVGGVPGGGTAMSAQNPVKLNYNGKEISVGIGMFQEQTQTFVQSFGDEYNSVVTHRFGFQFILAALQDHGTAKETPASQDFLNCISDVRFYIPYWRNEDGSTDASKCMLNTSAEPFDAGNLRTWRTVMVADNGEGFLCTLAMDFTYTEPGKEPVTYTVTSDGHYQKTERMDIYATNPDGPAGAYLDTAEKLNAVLSSRENLKAWLAEYFPVEYSNYDKVDTMTIYLPAVEYADIIVMNCPWEGETWEPNIALYGTGEYLNPQTVMPGFVHKAGGHELRYIYFRGDPTKKVTYKNSSFTCGVLMNGSADAYSDMIGVGSCVFDGLDYGTYSTANGFTGGGSENIFRNCTYGLYIDCKGKEIGAANDEFILNQFINCKVAVWIKSLPAYITPYMLRIVDSAFLNNQHDIKVTTPGRHYYYFYRNFYYGTYQEISPISSLMEGRAAIVDTTGSDAVVLTSPSRRYQDDAANLWVFENSAGILNSEAENLQIDQNALTGLTEEKEIAVIENASSGETVAVWTFGTEGGAAE